MMVSGQDGECYTSGTCDVVGTFVDRDGVEVCVGWQYADANGYSTVVLLGAMLNNQGDCIELCDYLYPGEPAYIKIYDSSYGSILDLNPSSDLPGFNNNEIFIVEGTSTAYNTFGCTDPAAVNYDGTATVNDGSCLYNSFWFVSVDGSDSNDGDQANPFATIQYGINAAYEGQTVLVAAGTYSGEGNIDLDFDGKAITVMSEAGAEQTIIDCGGTDERGFSFENGEDSTSVLDGFTITNGRRPEGGGIYCYYSSPTIKNCIIQDCYANADGGGIYLDGSRPSLSNVSISGNIAERFGGGIYMIDPQQ